MSMFDHDENDDYKRITYTYYNNNDAGADFAASSNLHVTHNYHFDTTWDVVLDDFIKFLSHAWGYDISDQVFFRNTHDRLQDLKEEYGDLDDEPFPQEDEL